MWKQRKIIQKIWTTQIAINTSNPVLQHSSFSELQSFLLSKFGIVDRNITNPRQINKTYELKNILRK